MRDILKNVIETIDSAMTILARNAMTSETGLTSNDMRIHCHLEDAKKHIDKAIELMADTEAEK